MDATVGFRNSGLPTLGCFYFKCFYKSCTECVILKSPSTQGNIVDHRGTLQTTTIDKTKVSKGKLIVPPTLHMDYH